MFLKSFSLLYKEFWIRIFAWTYRWIFGFLCRAGNLRYIHDIKEESCHDLSDCYHFSKLASKNLLQCFSTLASLRRVHFNSQNSSGSQTVIFHMPSSLPFQIYSLDQKCTAVWNLNMKVQSEGLFQSSPPNFFLFWYFIHTCFFTLSEFQLFPLPTFFWPPIVPSSRTHNRHVYFFRLFPAAEENYKQGQHEKQILVHLQEEDAGLIKYTLGDGFQ